MVARIAMYRFVRARAIFLLLAGMSASVAGVRVARADGSSPSTSTPANVETDDARFQRLKAEGDRALAEKRLSDAIKAYNAALEVRRDPLIAGRMGLTISYFDDPLAFEAAAGLLNDAVTDAAGATSQEKDAFFAAYKRMRKLVCKLSITTNDVNTVIDLGAGFKSRLPAFFIFVKKGKGDAVAKLDGRDDIRKTWDCKGDHDIDLQFEFPPVVAAPSKTITVTEKGKETVKIVHVPVLAENPIDTTVSNANRLSVWFGPSVLVGAAQSPAYGLSISGAYKLGNWSAMLGARGAYAFGPIERNTIDVFTFSGLAGPCFREKWFKACAFGSLNMVEWIPTTSIPGDFRIDPLLTPGIGIRIGGQYRISNTLALYLDSDATVLADDLELSIRRLNTLTSVWNGGRFLVTVSLGVEFAR